MEKVTYSTPLARDAMAYVLAGGRGSRLMELTERRAQARGLLRRQVAHHRFRAVERAQFRHPAHRGRHAIQGAQPDPAPAARLELPAAGAQRELRHPAGEPARRRGPVVRGHRRRGLPEHRHHRRLRARIHHHPRRRSHLQDGLRADAGPARQRRRRRHRRRASKCRSPRRPASASCTSTRADRIVSFVEKPPEPAGDARPPRLGAREHGHLRVQPRVPARAAAARRRRIRSRAATSAATSFPGSCTNGKAIAHRFAQSCVQSRAEGGVYWRDVGTLDAYWEANIDLTDVVPALDLYRPRLADLDLCRNHAAREIRARRRRTPRRRHLVARVGRLHRVGRGDQALAAVHRRSRQLVQLHREHRRPALRRGRTAGTSSPT